MSSLRAWIAASVLILSAISPVLAFDFFESTYLLEVRQGSQLSAKASSAQDLGYESALGQPVSMLKWYSTRWVDLHIAYITQINRDFGVIWGLSSGERADKYVIAPSWKIGFLYTTEAWAKGRLVLRAYRVFSGALREKSCTADYGEIGGVREVNCRLAASLLTPEETLQYNFHDKPFDRNFISIEYRREF